MQQRERWDETHDKGEETQKIKQENFMYMQSEFQQRDWSKEERK